MRFCAAHHIVFVRQREEQLPEFERRALERNRKIIRDEALHDAQSVEGRGHAARQFDRKQMRLFIVRLCPETQFCIGHIRQARQHQFTSTVDAQPRGGIGFRRAEIPMFGPVNVIERGNHSRIRRHAGVLRVRQLLARQRSVKIVWKLCAYTLVIRPGLGVPAVLLRDAPQKKERRARARIAGIPLYLFPQQIRAIRLVAEPGIPGDLPVAVRSRGIRRKRVGRGPEQRRIFLAIARIDIAIARRNQSLQPPRGLCVAPVQLLHRIHHCRVVASLARGFRQVVKAPRICFRLSRLQAAEVPGRRRGVARKIVRRTDSHFGIVAIRFRKSSGED